MKRCTTQLIPAVFAALTLAGPAIGSEGEDRHDRVHEFHEMMEQLGEHTQRIVQAINHEDWEWVASEARAIAEHSRPPAEERRRIRAFTGDRHAKFAEYDKAVHSDAAELAESADEGDGREVINAFARLQTSCLDCHGAFRAEFRRHFYLTE
ncbi:cytochrome c [Guyparkeria hydrothermalis]|uniref:cytochrome c n=1 Tax=Guyparkeria hydrothermalis TaxID=923 RepID=UPI00202011FF|nr:cytochrome c [Guyparkeria hydrothermalis]MCL7743759.1 cytochrome c [Guyparkeria hydrothermalis]